MKRIITCAAVVAMLAVSATSFAGIHWTKDLADNKNINYTESRCPDRGGWKAVGLAYVEKTRDKVDAVAVVCRKRNGEEQIMTTRDFDNNNNTPLKVTCRKGWKWVGIYEQDKKGTDAMDAATVICKRRGVKEEVYNRDLDQPQQGLTIELLSNRDRIVGIATKDLQNSDDADAVTFISSR